MVSLYFHDGATSRRRRDAEAVALALHDEYRNGHGIELRQATRRGLSGASRRRLQREGETQDAHGASLRRSAACDAGAGRATADDERQPAQVLLPEVVDDRDPRGVELVCRSLRATSCDAIGLVDECDAEPVRERCVGDGDEVSGADSAPGAMSQDEGASSLAHRVHMRSREPMGSLDVDGPHA